MADPSVFKTIAKTIVAEITHCRELNMQVVEAAQGHLTLELPFNNELVGNPDTGVIHGGAITTLMDSACGFAAALAIDPPGPCPTLDLRIDYMMAAKPNKSIFGAAEVYRISHNVVFARGIAYQDKPDSPIAHCVATFMRIENPTIQEDNRIKDALLAAKQKSQART